MPLLIRISRPHGRFQITDRNGTQYEPYYLTGSDSCRPEVKVTLDSGRVVRLPASRLSAFAQLPADEMFDEDHPFVDHVNRDITDQSSTNLEGVDGSENAQRSYDTNLGRKSKRLTKLYVCSTMSSATLHCTRSLQYQRPLVCLGTLHVQFVKRAMTVQRQSLTKLDGGCSSRTRRDRGLCQASSGALTVPWLALLWRSPISGVSSAIKVYSTHRRLSLG